MDYPLPSGLRLAVNSILHPPILKFCKADLQSFSIFFFFWKADSQLNIIKFDTEITRGREKQHTESNGGFKQVPLKEDPDYRHHIYNLQRQPRYKTWKQNPKKKEDKNIRKCKKDITRRHIYIQKTASRALIFQSQLLFFGPKLYVQGGRGKASSYFLFHKLQEAFGS